MPARVKPPNGHLVVAFFREGQEAPAHMLRCRDGLHAWQQAIHTITLYEALEAGDTLLVRRAEEWP